MTKNRQQYSVRSTSLSEEINEHILERIKDRSFKEYFLELIEKDLNEHKLTNSIEILIQDLGSEIKKDINELHNKISSLEKTINERSFKSVPHIEKMTSEEDELKEGQVVNVDIETKGIIESSEFEFDF